jgi:CubicO group peptidase (beta-lactamase class C family)
MSARTLWLFASLVVGCSSSRALAPPASAVGASSASPNAARTEPAVAPWQPPKLDPERRAQFEKLVPELDKLLAEDQKASGAPGLGVGIVIGGETVYATGFGLRDVEAKKPFTSTTPFPIASITKSFTAMAILKLRDEGKVDLDVPAARYYAPLAKLVYASRDAPPVTLRHLLTHSSGMPEDNPWADVTEDLTDADLAKILDGGVTSRASGVAFEYSNIGYGVLGRVIANVSGMSSRAYISRAILEPLGMTHSGWAPQDFPEGTLAVGYRGREGSREIEAPRVIAPAENLGVMDAAGGLHTTIEDLARYVAFHLSAWPPRDDPETGPLRRSSVREMQQGMRPMNLAEFMPRLVGRFPPAIASIGKERLALHAFAYGFGLNTHVTCSTDGLVEHSGGLPGYNSFLAMIPEAGIGVITFLNDERQHSKAVAATIALLLARGLANPALVSPVPALVSAQNRVNELLSTWDDRKARSIFEPTFFRYQSMEALQARFAALAREHGSCRLEGEPNFVNRLRASWRMTCERGVIQFAAGLAPGPNPRLQALELRQVVPPGPAMEKAFASAADLLRRWDARKAATLFAKSIDVAKVQRDMSALALGHGACKLDRAVEGDGKMRAVFALSCQDRPLELTLAIDGEGRITQIAGHPPRSEKSPHCAE